MTWRIKSLGEIYNRGEPTAIYFDAASGDTHLVSDFAAHLLQMLTATPLTTDAILTRLADDIDEEDAADLLQAVPGLLNQLAELDILCCTP
jgi:PqqD family protein of HPr-rel-A system